MSVFFRSIEGLSAPANLGAAYRLVWRWHFYAGLFCLPFVLVLALSGAVYIFKPQIDAYFDRGFDHLALAGAPKPLDAQVEAALAAHPDARFKALELRADPSDAARVRLVRFDGRELRVLVRPDTLQIMATQDEKSRLSTTMHDLHGELLLGEPGAIAMELAGAWALVMVLTGFYLWWPRGVGLAGVLYPRLDGDTRTLLRDLHSVTGFYLTVFALFLLITALPWTKVWGEGFKYARGVGQTREVKQDWTTGPASEKAQRVQAFRDAPPAASEDEHAEHNAAAAAGGEHAGHAGHVGKMRQPIAGFDRIADLARPLHLADPVLVTPPSPKRVNWIVKSDAQNRTARATIEYDPKTLEVVKREGFADRSLIDRIVAVGVAGHEGHLFGLANQLLNLVVALGFLVLVITSPLMWLSRRPQGLLGAPPPPPEAPRLAPFMVGLVLFLALFLPTLGASLALVLIAERLLRRFSPGASRWLGLVRPA